MTSSDGNIFRVTGPLCGHSPVTGEFPAQRPVIRSFVVFFDLCLNRRLSKPSRHLWLETPPLLWWRHCNEATGNWEPYEHSIFPHKPEWIPRGNTATGNHQWKGYWCLYRQQTFIQGQSFKNQINIKTTKATSSGKTLTTSISQNSCRSVEVWCAPSLQRRHNECPHLKPPASWLSTQPFVQTQIKEDINAPRHWPLWGGFTGDRWIPRTKGQ